MTAFNFDSWKTEGRVDGVEGAASVSSRQDHSAVGLGFLWRRVNIQLSILKA